MLLHDTISISYHHKESSFIVILIIRIPKQLIDRLFPPYASIFCLATTELEYISFEDSWSCAMNKEARKSCPIEDCFERVSLQSSLNTLMHYK